jgi:hypothetical protein
MEKAGTAKSRDFKREHRTHPGAVLEAKIRFA